MKLLETTLRKIFKTEKYINYVKDKKIKEAISLYAKNMVSHNQLLSDVNDVKNGGDDLEEAFNPYLYNQKKKGIETPRGVTILESLFNNAAIKLRFKKPLDIIKAIFYGNALRNDSEVEKLLLDMIGKKILDRNNIIYNPSPRMIELCQVNDYKGTYYVRDGVMKNLYSLQYGKDKFYSLEDVKEHDKELAIFLTANIEKEFTSIILSHILESNVQKAVGIIETSSMIENEKSVFWDLINKSNFSVKSISMLPTSLSSSYPRKKCIVFIERNKTNNNIELYKVLHNKDKGQAIYHSKYIKLIDKKELLKYGTLNTLWEHIVEGKKISKKEKTSNEAQPFYFTKEIVISYLIYKDKKTKKPYGKAYYAETKDIKDTSVRGMSISKRVEKGLRAETEEKVIQKLDKVPYYKEMEGIIREDLKRNFFTQEIIDSGDVNYSIKTIYYYLRNTLKGKDSFNDEFAQEIFRPEKSELCNICLNNISRREILELVQSDFDEDDELEVLTTLNIIIREAEKRRIVNDNIVEPLLPSAKRRLSERQKEVRRALFKTSFEPDEEKIVFNEFYKNAVRYSINLGALIRLLTGASKRDVCALTWNDLKENKMGFFSLSITKYIEESGKIKSYASKEKLSRKYRAIPLAKVLAKRIIERRNYLVKEKGIDLQQLKEYPIVLPKEEYSYIVEGGKPRFCKPSVITRYAMKVVKKVIKEPQYAILPGEEGEEEVATNLDEYNGDILYSNFKNKTYNIAKLGEDEIAHYVGIKKPNTFSEHYCDYENDLVQLMMYKKINRWTNKYLDEEEASLLEKDKCIITGGDNNVACVELDVDCNSKLALIIEAESDFKVITSIDKGRLK